MYTIEVWASAFEGNIYFVCYLMAVNITDATTVFYFWNLGGGGKRFLRKGLARNWVPEEKKRQKPEVKIANLLYPTKYQHPCNFLASRDLFSVVFAERTSARKRDLCPGSKRTVLRMRHGYLTIEPSHDAMLLCGLTK